MLHAHEANVIVTHPTRNRKVLSLMLTCAAFLVLHVYCIKCVLFPRLCFHMFMFVYVYVYYVYVYVFICLCLFSRLCSPVYVYVSIFMLKNKRKSAHRLTFSRLILIMFFFQ